MSWQLVGGVIVIAVLAAFIAVVVVICRHVSLMSAAQRRFDQMMASTENEGLRCRERFMEAWPRLAERAEIRSWGDSIEGAPVFFGELGFDAKGQRLPDAPEELEYLKRQAYLFDDYRAAVSSMEALEQEANIYGSALREYLDLAYEAYGTKAALYIMLALAEMPKSRPFDLKAARSNMLDHPDCGWLREELVDPALWRD